MTINIGRRGFIAGVGGAATWPLAGHGQPRAIPVIGFLSSVSPGPFARNLEAFRQGLKETGYVEGRNATIEYRWAEATSIVFRHSPRIWFLAMWR
jgi:putative ABC transport system substrate-binding protein